MNDIVKKISRLGNRKILVLKKNSPTYLVVGGVVGMGVTAVLAAKATRNIDPILDTHAKRRIEISENVSAYAQDEQKQIVKLYTETTLELGKLYAPTIAVGTLSAVSILHGHKILKGRHLATMAAYTGLMEQYQSYRTRVAQTIGDELENELYNGAIGVREEDPEHPGEYKMKTKYVDKQSNYLRPFFDEANDNWTPDPTNNIYFLKGVQAHMNRLLNMRGHLFLFEVYDSLGIPRTKETIVTGWLRDNASGDGFVDFGYMTDPSPEAAMFRNGAEPSIRLNFNVDGVIWNLID